MIPWHAETAADRERERQAARALARAWGCELIACPRNAGYDYTAQRDGQVVGVVEIKTRLNRAPSDFGGWLLLDDHKAEALLRAAAKYQPNCAPIFAWCFPLVVHWLDVRHLRSNGSGLELRGRSDRDGPEPLWAWRVHLSSTRRLVLRTFTRHALADQIERLYPREDG